MGNKGPISHVVLNISTNKMCPIVIETKYTDNAKNTTCSFQ